MDRHEPGRVVGAAVWAAGDILSVKVDYGFDLGLASSTVTKRKALPPAQWRRELGLTQ